MIIYLQMIEGSENKAKFEQLYNEYHRLMYHIAYKITGSKYDAEDAVHEAFLKVAEHIKKIPAVSTDAKCLLCTIAENKAIDIARKNKLISKLPLEEAEHLCGISANFVSENNLSVFEGLPFLYSQVLWLKYGHGYNLKEIADLLDQPLPKIQKINQRAKKKLEGLLREREASL